MTYKELKEKLDNISAQVAEMPAEDVKNCRLIETRKRVEWRGPGIGEVEIEPAVREYRIFYLKDRGICYIPKGKRRRGYVYELEPAVLNLELTKKAPITPEGEAKKWERSINKAIGMLEMSGLWPEVLTEMRTAREIGYNKLRLAYSAYWKETPGLKYAENELANAEAIREIDERLIKDGRPDTGILFYWAEQLKVKKMNFGKYLTDDIGRRIAEALRDKKSITESGRTSYDVSFSYDAEKNKAWYSEEFRGCGNGHYYLALNATHAVFYEND